MGHHRLHTRITGRKHKKGSSKIATLRLKGTGNFGKFIHGTRYKGAQLTPKYIRHRRVRTRMSKLARAKQRAK